jgi:serine protease inhibitor
MRSLRDSAGNQEVSIMSRKLFLLLALLTSACLLQCTKNPVSNKDEIVPESNWYARGLVESDNKFGIKLFKEIVKEEGDANIFISPLSVSMALGMTYNGANGSTKEAMEKTLELTGLTVEEVNESYKNLIRLLTQLDPKVQFDIANSIWYRDALTPETEFLDICNQYFDAQVTGMDFSAPQAADVINAWVDENTNGKIKEIVDKPIDPLIVMFLINAIYFKGAWTYQFDEELTKDDWFYLADGSAISCRMMEQRARHKCLANDVFDAVDIPYGDGGFSMTIFLPHRHLHTDDIMAQLDQDNYDLWISSLSFPQDSFNVYIPKFKLECELKLKEILGSLGMGIAFEPAGADFSKMYKDVRVWIDRVKHKTFVEVNEEGTEAAAVTSVGIRPESWPPYYPGFRADRPFVFVIRENESGVILFIGKIAEPIFEG